MRKLVGLFEGAFAFICLLSVLVTARPRSVKPMREWQPSLLPQEGVPSSSQWYTTLAPSRPQVAKAVSERRQETTTVRVTCHPDYMEIEMDADLLDLGFPVDVMDITLGGSEQGSEACRALPTEPGKYTIAALLTDCGTQHWITPDYLIYRNSLEYSPGPSADGLIRTQAASFPLECHFRRRFDLSSIPVAPTWVPFMSTRADEGQLDFSLRLMTDDWAFPRATTAYYLGDVIHIEASVRQFKHNPMRVFVDDCVATVTPDANSVPRYAFIEHGCLADSYMTGSSSRFHPRQQNDRLQFQLDAFRFHQEEQVEIYITCMLRAEPIGEANGMSRACTFMDNGWQSADGEHWLCESCLSAGPAQAPSHQETAPVVQSPTGSHGGGSSSGGHSQFVHMRPRSESPQPRSLDSSKGWEKEERIGPISVLKKSQRPAPPPKAARGLPQFVPETEMASPVAPKVAPKTFSASTYNDRHSMQLDKPDYKALLPASRRPDDGNMSQFFDVWKRRASPKDWTAMMHLLQGPSPAMTSADTATHSMTEATSLPEEDPIPPSADLEDQSLFAFKSLAREDEMSDMKLDFDAESFEPSPSEGYVVVPGNASGDGMKR